MFNEYQKYIVFDYETYSECDLKKSGAYEYSKHHSTEVVCVSWTVGTRAELKRGNTKIYSWSPQSKKTLSGNLIDLVELLTDKDMIIVAHNAYFEKCITRNVLPKYISFNLQKIPNKKWVCSASMAAALSLPRHLEGACQSLNLPVQKDMEGRRLMLKWCKPRKPSKKNPSTRHDDQDELLRLIQYCEKDVEAQSALFSRLPHLHPNERKVWLLDQQINERGFHIDRKAVEHTLELIDIESKRLNYLTNKITNGEVQSTTQRDASLRWLKVNGGNLPNLQAQTIKNYLESGLGNTKVKQLLKVRQAASKTSTAKYKMLECRTRVDGRLRDYLLYHGATTGRWSGSGVQPQNLPRPSLTQEQIECAINLILDGDYETLKLCFGSPMEVFSSCIRGMFTASPGKVLYAADYAAIEARVLFWVAKHLDGVKAFKEKRPMYEEMGAKIFSVPMIKVTKDSLARFVGKQSILGMGYMMGADRFVETCANFGVEITKEIAQIAVNTYRSVHSPVVKLWKNMELAAIAATKRPGTKYTINRVSWIKSPKFLYCILPSGRRLAYPSPLIEFKKTKWGEKKETLTFMGMCSITHKWRRLSTYGGKLTENIVQAISRDLMADAMLRVEAKGWSVQLTVHDEIIAETDYSEKRNIDVFCKLMAQTPDWAKGCPVAVDGWQGFRYRK